MSQENDNKNAQQGIGLHSSLHIDSEGNPSVCYQGVPGELMSAKEAVIKMKSGIYGLFIMLQHQAFFFPVTAQLSRAHQSMLFQQIDATRKACLDALKSADGNIAHSVAEVILVSPPEREGDEEFVDVPQKATASFQRDAMSQKTKERIALKVKQSLNTVGLEPQWREHFQSIVPPEPGTVPVLHLQKGKKDDDDRDGGESGSTDGATEPEHTWSLLYTTQTADGVITEEIHKYKHQPEQELGSDLNRGPRRK